jgi:hypothetical protein
MGEEFEEMTSSVRKAVYRAVARRRRKQGLAESEALEKGLKEKSVEFAEKGSEVYAKA